MTDSQSNTVYLSAALERHRSVYDQMRHHLSAAGIDVRLVKQTRNVWIRDWAPLQVNEHFVKFLYVHDDTTWPQLYVPDCAWENIGNVKRSDIVLDGGNVVRHQDKVLMTEIVFEQNPDWKHGELIDELEETLQAKIIFLPVEPGDDLGHSDGIAAWVDSNMVFTNDYHISWVPELQEYGKKVRAVFSKAGIEAEPFPFAYQANMASEKDFRRKHPDADSYLPAVGYWINFLHVEKLVLFPLFGRFDDQHVMRLLHNAFPDCSVVGIQCRDLAEEGGLLHCVSAAYCL